MRGELITAADVDRLDRVGESEFLEQNNDLLTVSGRPKIQVDHETLSCFLGPEVWFVAIAGRDCPPLKVMAAERRRGGLLASDRRGNYYSRGCVGAPGQPPPVGRRVPWCGFSKGGGRPAAQ